LFFDEAIDRYINSAPGRGKWEGYGTEDRERGGVVEGCEGLTIH